MGHHTTRYQYYYTQAVSNINEGWVADPIATMGAASIARSGGANVAQDVENGIRTGIGIDLLKYYQYSTRRFKKRNASWTLRQVFQSASEKVVISENELKTLDPTLGDKHYRIIQEDKNPVMGGMKFLADMQTKYGLDYFHDTDSRGNSVAINTLSAASGQIDGVKYNTWIVGTANSPIYKSILLVDPRDDDSKFTSVNPYYVLDTYKYEPKPSVGISYWVCNAGPAITIKDKRTENFSRSRQEEDYSTYSAYVKNKEYIISKESNWQIEDFDGEGAVVYGITDNVDTAPKPEPAKVPIEKITYKKFKVTSGDLVGVSVDFWTEEHTVIFDEERFLYGTETENLNVWKLYKDARAVKEVGVLDLNSDKDKRLFKLFPYIPIKEHFEDVFETGKAKKLMDAYKTVSEAARKADEAQVKKEEDAPKANKEVAKLNRKREKNEEVKKAQRTIQRSGKYKRKLTVRKVDGLKPSDKRHLIQMGKYLNVDPRELALAGIAQNGSDKVMFSAVQPASKIASNFDTMEKYNYIFFKKLMKILGDGGYSKFSATLRANFAKTKTFKPSDLPRYEFDYHVGQLHCRMSFCFIKEFEMKGTLRKTKRKHKIQETRRGKVTTLYNNKLRWEEEEIGDNGATRSVPVRYKDFEYSPEQTIQMLLNPPEEFAGDRYYTTAEGAKQYNIGGDNNRGVHTAQGGRNFNLSEMTLSSYGYTFFCKQVSKDRVKVIAVAGLTGGMRSSHENYWDQHLNADWFYASAYHELGLLYERNRLKYIDKKASGSIDVSIQFQHGGSRYKTYNKFQTFFLIPLDMRSAMKLGGADLTRFATRAIWQHQWTHTETHSKSLGFIKIIVAVVGLIIAIIAAGPTWGGSLSAYFSALGTMLGTSAFWANLITNLVIAQVISFAVNKGIALLARMLGLKGFLALIVAVVIAAAVAYAGGFDMNQSAMPYASEVASRQVATNVATTTTQSMTSSFTKSIAQEVAKITYKDIAKSIIFEGGSYLGGQMQQQQLTDLQKQAEIEQQAFNAAMSVLEEKQEGEKLTGVQYDVKEVLKALNVRIKAQDPSTFYGMATMDVNELCGIDFLSGFLQSKLSLDLNSFDPVSSLNFSTKLNQSTTLGGV
nr:MAG TPA: hypothetical protein [Caudoviricetes sp.]